MTGGTPYLATDTPGAGQRFQKHPRGPGEVAHPRSRPALRRALPRFLLAAFALLAARDALRLTRFATAALTCASPTPTRSGCCWRSRRRCSPTPRLRRGGAVLARLGDGALVARMTAGVSVARKVVRAGAGGRGAGADRAGAGPPAGGRAGAARQAAGAGSGGGARFLAVDAGQGRLPVAAGAGQARARAADDGWPAIASAWSPSRARR